jgi:cell division protein FtsB
MRAFALILAVLVVLIQYPLWLGKGGWLGVWDADHQLASQKAKSERLQARNEALDAEVRDLKQGYEAIEERARFELGMVRKDEIFFQVVDPVVRDRR